MSRTIERLLICSFAALLISCGSDSDSDSPSATGDAESDTGTGSDTPLQDGSESAGDSTVATISRDNYDTILREIVKIANDEPLDAASDSLVPVFDSVKLLIEQALADGASSGNGLTFVSTAPISDDGEHADHTFSCDSGGTLVATAWTSDDLDGANVEKIVAANACSIGDAAYEGSAFKQVTFARQDITNTFENFSISKADGDSTTLDGDYSVPDATRGPVSEKGWNDASLVQVAGGETTSITAYNSLRRSIQYLFPEDSSGSDSAIFDADDPNAMATVTFTASAPWSAGETLDVSVDLAYSDPDGFELAGDRTFTSDPIPAQWNSGTIRVTAADGSGLTVSADTGDAATFSVVIDGEAGDPLVNNWADGFQVSCPAPFVCS